MSPWINQYVTVVSCQWVFPNTFEVSPCLAMWGRRKMASQMLEIALALALVAIGGLGSMARFWVSGAVARKYGETSPWGTLAVNVSGAAVIGVLAAALLAAETMSFRTGPFGPAS